MDAWKRRRRIRELQRKILEVHMERHDDDPHLDAQIAHEAAKEGEYRLACLLEIPRLQAAEKWGLEIPSEFWEDWDDSDIELESGEWAGGRTLSDKGRRWVAREAGKRRREWAKDWVSILSPLFSLVISALGLVVALVIALKQQH